MLAVVRKAREVHKKAIEQLYEDVCTVCEYQSIKNEKTKLTEKREVVILENLPCKISFENTAVTAGKEGAAEQEISVKLFLAPNINIKAGSKVIVIHNGETTAYSNSGVSARFFTHQEIELKLFERWA
ncbi:MAG: hypothetical protein K1W19_11615 [Lachnospiraceae bacterium]